MFESQDRGMPNKTAVAAYRTGSMIVAALAFSIGIYFAIGLLLTGQRPGDVDADSLRKIVYPVAVVLAAASILLRRFLLGWPRIEALGASHGSAGVARHLLNATLVSAALGELVAVLGLVMAILGGDFMDMVRLGGIGLVLIVFSYPRKRAWNRTIDHFAAKSGEASALADSQKTKGSTL
jgi:hypothetical protein